MTKCPVRGLRYELTVVGSQILPCAEERINQAIGRFFGLLNVGEDFSSMSEQRGKLHNTARYAENRAGTRRELNHFSPGRESATADHPTGTKMAELKEVTLQLPLSPW